MKTEKEFEELVRTKIVIEKILEDPTAFATVYQVYKLAGKPILQCVRDLLKEKES